MNLELEKAAVADHSILERLLQLELYEIGMEPGANGLIDWGESLEKFFTDPSCIPLFMNMDGRLVGFVLLKLDRNPTGPDGKTPMRANMIEEFYVMRPYRRKGIGTLAVDLIIKRFPGRWIATTWPNAQRVAFWRHVAIGRDTMNGREFSAGEHAGFPGQYVWVIEPNKPDAGDPRQRA